MYFGRGGFEKYDKELSDVDELWIHEMWHYVLYGVIKYELLGCDFTAS